MTRIDVAGHFGEWVQGRLGPQGPVVLVTLPCAVTGVDMTYDASRPGLRLHRVGLVPAEVRGFLARLGVGVRGTVRMRARIAPGLGTGVSTARLIGLARLAGWQGAAEQLALACIAAEGASDPLMYPAPERLLWASRLGQAMALLPPLPRYEILGGFWGGACWTDPGDAEFDDISDLVAAWGQTRDLAGFAELASASAARCQARRGPEGDPTATLARALGALGWLRAHTGAARGLIFAPGGVPDQAEAALRRAGLRGICRFRGGGR